MSKDIAIIISLDKHAALAFKREKIVEQEESKMTNNNNIKTLSSKVNDKFLGILEADNKNSLLKKNIAKEYYQRIKKILWRKLNGGNLYRQLTYEQSQLLRYTAGIINWKQAELETMDQKNLKIMRMHHSLHLRNDTDHL